MENQKITTSMISSMLGKRTHSQKEAKKKHDKEQSEESLEIVDLPKEEQEVNGFIDSLTISLKSTIPLKMLGFTVDLEYGQKKVQRFIMKAGGDIHRVINEDTNFLITQEKQKSNVYQKLGVMSMSVEEFYQFVQKQIRKHKFDVTDPDLPSKSDLVQKLIALKAKQKEQESAPEIKNQSFKCYNCNEEGHVSKDCPKPRICMKCGKQGHVASSCYKRSEYKREPISCFKCSGDHFAKDCDWARD